MKVVKDYPAAYQATTGSALDVDKAFYQRLVDATDQRTKIDEFLVRAVLPYGLEEWSESSVAPYYGGHGLEGSATNS